MAIYIPDSLVFDSVAGQVDVARKKFFETLASGVTSLPWTSIDFTGSTLTDITVRSAAALNAGTLPLARLSGITNTEIAAAAAIAWTKVSKSGALLRDLASQAVTTTTGNQDNVNFANVDSLICNNGSATTFRGLLAGSAGQTLTLLPINAQLDLADQHAGSVAANRIITGSGGTITPARFADLVYDGATLRWRVAGYA